MQRDDTSIRVRRSIKDRLDDYKNKKQLDSLSDAVDRLLENGELSDAVEDMTKEIKELKKLITALEQKR